MSESFVTSRNYSKRRAPLLNGPGNCDNIRPGWYPGGRLGESSAHWRATWAGKTWGWASAALIVVASRAGKTWGGAAQRSLGGLSGLGRRRGEPVQGPLGVLCALRNLRDGREQRSLGGLIGLGKRGGGQLHRSLVCQMG